MERMEVPHFASEAAHVPTVVAYTTDELAAEGLRPDRLPRHIAVIMDGNGRWAKARGLPRIEGHRRGVKSVRLLVEECCRLGIEQLTLYCFSSENWKRPRHELSLLMHLLEQYVIEERSEIMRQQIRFTTIGRRDGLGAGVLREVDRTIEFSRPNTGMGLCLALNYGARAEIVDAVREIARKVECGMLDPDDVNEETVSSYLYTAGIVDPDLVIRTAGEMRVSNFLLWQISYAELWVTETCWPDFRRKELIQALRDFAVRDRRFGGLKD
ncbi:MAG TPA: isoprenyl transferase [Planctomycetaceae bacterium]|nr:isoprenyl transferase [Planctomycetaceae bacterium]